MLIGLSCTYQSPLDTRSLLCEVVQMSVKYNYTLSGRELDEKIPDITLIIVIHCEVVARRRYIKYLSHSKT